MVNNNNKIKKVFFFVKIYTYIIHEMQCQNIGDKGLAKKGKEYQKLAD